MHSIGWWQCSAAFVMCAALGACGDDGESDDTGDDMTPDAASFVVTPGSADVATCRSKQFTAAPGDGVTWTASAGTIDSSGLFHAPTAVPGSGTATITALRMGATASATATLATAFPGAVTAQLGAETMGFDEVHGVAAKGMRAYAIAGATLVRSDDGGLTFPMRLSAPLGSRSPAVAVDAGDPNTVYVTTHKYDPNAGSELDLLVSTDGGATWVSHPLMFGGTGETEDADVVSPAAGQVVVTAPATWQDGMGHEGATLLVWHDAAKGTMLGAGTEPLDNGYDARWAIGQEYRLGNGRLIETNSSRGGPHLATNGAGKVCLLSNDYGINDDGEIHTLRCSTDSGATFGAPVTVASTDHPSNLNRSRVAVGHDGSTVVVTYVKYNNGSVDVIGKTAYRVSTDGGATFGSEHEQVDDLGTNGDAIAVANTEAFVDSENVIWLARSLGDAAVEIDKSCDQGVTLSGRFTLDLASPNASDPVVFESSAGVFAGGRVVPSATTGLKVLRLVEAP